MSARTVLEALAVPLILATALALALVLAGLTGPAPEVAGLP